MAESHPILGAGGEQPSGEVLEAAHEEALAAHLEAEGGFRRDHPWLWLLTLVGPFVFSALVLTAVYLLIGPSYANRLFWTALATFFFFGRFVILGGSEGGLQEISSFMTAGQLFALVTYLDVMVAIVLIFHMGFLFKAPLLGPRVKQVVADGRFILSAHPWMKRATLVGLAVFVMFPLASSGSVGGSIFGRLLGLGRALTFLGVVAGSLLGNSLMYLGSDLLNVWFDKDSALFRLSGLAAVVLIILILEHRYRKMKNVYLTRPPEVDQNA